MANLFLDDIRNPQDCRYANNVIYFDRPWVVVRSFNEFADYIMAFGMPDRISFDHDLADTHYTPEHLWDDYEASKAWQEAQTHTEKTGYDCAKWLVDYCIDNNCKLPTWHVHSMNPVGADNINALLNNFLKHF